ncbi:hypothetical protein PYEL_03480 [Pseudomonas sp. URMO17WK12:I11]|uniref:hypothetical protein n=1 Tax=Pseudomonas sp. URMO17WK12:I11 TaxID=1283291 RepID=UPI000721A29F|nr:hypothetical protein [Pseudomonas sp. URMO17WK12:I11]CRN04631.1 hypothetical protein PYEL_03480 [Pseudomonas sp. URMO17WK12:I11]
MSFFKGKFDSISNKLSDAVSNGREALSDVTDKTMDYSRRVSGGISDIYDSAKEVIGEVVDGAASSNIVVSSREQVLLLSDGAKEKYVGISSATSAYYYSSTDRVKGYASFSAEKVSTYFSKTFEVDKETNQIVSEIQGKLPARPKDVDDIFQQTKDEALRRAIAAFCLAPVMSGLDQSNEAKYSNLSSEYKDFKKENNLHDNANFAALDKERDLARFAPGRREIGQPAYSTLENGYDSGVANRLDPYATDIEHIIPKSEIYNDFLLRIATNDDGIIESMNFSENLIFADQSLNRSKADIDLKQYIADRGRRDPDNPDQITFTIGVNGREVTISEKDALKRYDEAKEQMASMRLQAMKEVGLSVASAGARMAAQQVVGLIVSETIDIFVDEIKDVTQKGLITDKKGVMQGLEERRANLSAKLSARFEERNVMQKAKEAGIEGGVAGVLSAIPQILISMIVKLPALVLSVIRECTLSTVRCVRVMLSNAEDKYGQIAVVLFGAASTVIGLYVANTISKALMTVPLLNLFNHSVADVLTGVLVTAVPLAAVYVFDENKAKFVFGSVGKDE